MLSICKSRFKICINRKKITPVVCGLCDSNISHLVKLKCDHYLCTKCISICSTNNISCIVCFKKELYNKISKKEEEKK